MPEDQGDVFLRHRGAVLDAVLSDPSFGPPESTPAATADGPASPPDDPSSVAAQPIPSPDSAPSARRVDTGPRASDRIMALLSGESAGGPAQLDFTSDFSERSGRLGAAEQSSAAESGAPEQAAKPAARDRQADLPQQILTQIRKPKVALAIAGVLAVLLVLVLVTTGGKDNRTQPLAVVTPASQAPAAPSKAPGDGSAESSSAVLAPKSAVSKCSAGSTDGMDAFSGEPGKAWSCKRSFKIDGQILTIDLGKRYQVDSIGIVPGWDSVGADGSDQWSKYRTVSRVSYEFNDPTQKKYTQETLDQRSLVVTKIDPPVNASKIILTVQQSKGDTSVNTTAISSIVITGH
ncbi:F5/8 type C domain-containing protein [Nocardia nova SH22a]|uniref:F5/8 type C domain-containing protein n=1 Tax=Nocardia nova SH22a TaxID=1415166 RepID=W5TBB7_9NOCA|nr:discoidin domain-containing protein [Nocardia nova]AHH16424.1 F5/8 type C domain-containing protein [Nocardia nova SH22a]